MFYSPLRYPGGKNKLAKFIAKICVDNSINGHYIEPYAGGASVALFLLLEGRVREITINDYDRSVFAFWHSVLNKADDLCQLIAETEINMSNWEHAKNIQKKKASADLLSLGFSTLYLNRTNRDGIMNAGVIGGKAQKGKYKIDCRFNKESIINKIKTIHASRSAIHLHNMDAADLIQDVALKTHNDNDVIFYFDPPYYLKGSSLYVNHYQHEDHEKISELIKHLKNIHWIVSYDNTPEIEAIYRWVKPNRIRKYGLNHSVNKFKVGKEIIFFSKGLRVPKEVLIAGR